MHSLTLIFKYQLVNISNQIMHNFLNGLHMPASDMSKLIVQSTNRKCLARFCPYFL